MRKSPLTVSPFISKAAQAAIIGVAAFTLIVIVWATWQVIQQPDIGALWTARGEVYYAKSDLSIQLGDVILTIDEVPAAESPFPYYLWEAGDTVQFEVLRDGQVQTLALALDEAAPPWILLMRLMITVVAFAFWGAGTAIVVLVPSRLRIGVLFFLWCQLMAGTLALGNVTSSQLSAYLSIIYAWWAVTVAVHFHILFPFQQFSDRLRRAIWLAYIPPALATLRLLGLVQNVEIPASLSLVHALAFYPWVSLGLLVVLFLLVRAYRATIDPEVRRQVGLIAMSGFLGLTPLMTLSVLPALLLRLSLFPTELSLLFLIAIPLGYGYAITRYKLVNLEEYISRSVTLILLVGLLAFTYFIIRTGLQRLFPENEAARALADFVSIVLLILLHNPLYRRLKTFFESLLYGGWYDFPLVVGKITSFLGKTTELRVLAQALCSSIQKTMRVHWVCLLLPGAEGRSIVELTGRLEAPSIFLGLSLRNLQTVMEVLRHVEHAAVGSQQILQQVDPGRLGAVEKRLLEFPGVRLWVPIHGRGGSIGVLILSGQHGGDSFDAVDMDILDVVSRQASIAFQNIQLISELESKAHENERYQREIVRTREEERKRIARDLHDQVIQSLIGLNYQLANVQSSLDLPQLNPAMFAQTEELRRNIGDLIQVTRALCNDLRPPALDLGLLHGIRSAAGRFEMQTGIEANLVVNGERELEIDEDVALCLYRCTNEALVNTYKHAGAHQVQIELNLDPYCISLTVADDGRGFQVPEKLGDLMEQNHFGLVGLREHLELVQGSFQIESEPGEGTRLQVRVPLVSMESQPVPV